mgnify:CR=1 FL=1
MEPKTFSLKISCPEHSHTIKSVVPNNLNTKNVLCAVCYNDQNEFSRIPVEEYVERCAQAQSEYTNLVTNVKKKLPKALKEVTELEAEAVKQLREYFEGQKGHIDYLFDKLQSDLRGLLKVEKEKLIKQLEEQVKALERNFTYYNLKLAKYDTSDPPEPVSIEAARKEVLETLDKIKNGLKFQEWVKDTNEDIEDLVIYSKFKSDENKMKGVARCLKFLSQQIQAQTKIRPVLSFNDDSLAKIKESIEEVFKSSVGFDNPIRELSISSFFFESDIISSPKEYEYVRSLVDEDGTSANIIQRVYTTKTMAQVSSLIEAIAKYPKTLILLRTCHGNIIGAYTDQSWARIPNPNYKSYSSYYGYYKNYNYSTQNQGIFIDGWKRSSKSFLFDLTGKQILRIFPHKASSAMWCPADVSKGVQFGSGPDLILLNNSTHGLKATMHPGNTYHPQEENELSTEILNNFAGGKDKRVEVVVSYLEAFAIINPENCVAPPIW